MQLRVVFLNPSAGTFMDLIATSTKEEGGHYSVPNATNTFFSSRGRLLKDIGSLLNTELCTETFSNSINSGLSLINKEATVPVLTLSEFSR